MTPEAIDAAIEYVSALIFYENAPEEFKSKFIGVMDAKLTTAISLLDVLISLKYLDINAKEQKAYESKYFGRILAINCHELLSNNEKYLANNATKEYKNIVKVKEEIEKVMINKKQCNVFFKKHQTKLLEI